MTRERASELIQDLFESWGPLLVRYAFRATGSQELADDVVQESFMGLYRVLRNGTSIDNPKSWTLVATRNHISKHWRRKNSHREESYPQELLEAIPDESLTWEHARRQEVVQFFSVLTPREEEVMLLRLQSLTYAEIASELGISRKSVGTLLARALRKLRGAVEAKSKGLRLSIANYHARKTLQ